MRTALLTATRLSAAPMRPLSSGHQDVVHVACKGGTHV
jgi:hypothetical protein